MTAQLNLRTLRLRPGEQYRTRETLTLEPYDLGGQRYVAGAGRGRAEVVVTAGEHRHRLRARVLGAAGGAVLPRASRTRRSTSRVRAREYQANDPEGDEELVDRVRPRGPARPGRVGAGRASPTCCPTQILCREDCAGLCPECGRNLNDEPHEHEQETSDPRWGALADLRGEL